MNDTAGTVSDSRARAVRNRILPRQQPAQSLRAAGSVVYTTREIKISQELAVLVQIECDSFPMRAPVFRLAARTRGQFLQGLNRGLRYYRTSFLTMLLANFAVADTTPTAPSQDVKLAGRSKPKPGNHDGF